MTDKKPRRWPFYSGPVTLSEIGSISMVLSNARTRLTHETDIETIADLERWLAHLEGMKSNITDMEVTLRSWIHDDPC